VVAISYPFPNLEAVALHRHLRPGVLDCAHDVVVPGASAEVSLDAVPDLVLTRVRVLGEEGRSRHDHARSAIAALEAMALPETLLNRMELAIVGEPLDGRDVGTLRLHGEHGAGFDRGAVDVDRTCPAIAGLATDVGPRQMKVLPDEVDQESPRLDVIGYLTSVDGHGHIHGGTFQPRRRTLETYQRGSRVCPESGLFP
jgi:hypothetical protein